MKKVSIIVPTIGRSSLKDTLKSLLAQTYKNLEIIVTDDTKEGKACEIVKEFPMDKIKYVKNEKYMHGPTGNKNNGLDHVTGEYFTFVDDDDQLLPEAIETLIMYAEERNYPIVMANCLDSKTGKFKGLSYGKDMEWTYEDFLRGYLDGDYFLIVATYLLNNERFKDDTWGAELLLWWKIFKKIKKGYYIDKALMICNTVSSGRVTIQMERYPERQVLNYYYTILEFGEDLLKINQKQYVRYILRGMYFAKLGCDTDKLKFFKESLKSVNHKTLKVFSYLYYLFVKMVPRKILLKANLYLYKTCIPLIKNWFKK
ncbi:glucosyltransferase [Caldimicrobium thiodismutans]|uniref:Glucosyltransferase n=1 Tax=Caldimicrobium thiodismutans TaxID=1653476 RepID=A0A0U5AI24_9BACT|nr:glycosyltransferase family 2 protein [Caldimicrobium thiodismutans]BAU23564.1 glucosyltransferase [Caldimicrobium thiodismutans]